MQSKVPLVMAVVFGVIAFFGIWAYMDRDSEAVEQVRQVVIVNRDVRAGDILEMALMDIMAVPASVAAQLQGTFEPDRRPSLHGATLTQNLSRGAILVEGALDWAPRLPDEGTLLERIRPGMRALSIPIDNAGMVSGFVQPGDRVDILANLEVPVERTRRVTAAGFSPVDEVVIDYRPTTIYLFQNIQVLAVGRQDRRTVGPVRGATGVGGGTVTIAVDPYQAQRLSFAMRHGRDGGRRGNVTFTLVLRSQGDTGEVELEMVDYDSLLELLDWEPATLRVE